MNIEPADIDRLIEGITNALITGITRLLNSAYEWYRKRQAPYYVPPPQQNYLPPYEDQPQAIYPEMRTEQKESE